MAGDAGGRPGRMAHPADVRPRPVPPDRAPPVEARGAPPEHDDEAEAPRGGYVDPLRHPQLHGFHAVTVLSRYIAAASYS